MPYLDTSFVTLPDGRVRRRSNQPTVVTIMGEFCNPAPAPDTLTVPTQIIYAADFGLVTEEQLAGYGDRVEAVPVSGGHDILWAAYPETSSSILRFLS